MTNRRYLAISVDIPATILLPWRQIDISFSPCRPCRRSQANMPRSMPRCSGTCRPGACGAATACRREAQLVRQFGVSRITVSRAVRDLQAAGLVERKPGSGTFVRGSRHRGRTLLRPPDPGPWRDRDLRADLPGHDGVAAGAAATRCCGARAGVTDSPAEARTWDLCRQYIDRQVSGVFFAPLEMSDERDAVNRRIGRALDEARIPVVLLDRTLLPYPDPGHHDLVGIDNRRAGYVITDHLLRQGCRRLAFVGQPNAASTVDAREAGYREALFRWQAPSGRELTHRLDPADAPAVQSLMATVQPDGIVCANDCTAGRLMKSLLDLGCRVPQDVRLVGIDDVGVCGVVAGPADHAAAADAGDWRCGAHGDARARRAARSAAAGDSPPRPAGDPRILRRDASTVRSG